MWKQIDLNEKCLFLREHTNQLYTYPKELDLHYSATLRSEADVTFYRKEDNTKQILIKKGWNEKGLWETTYWKWEVVDE